MASFIQSIFSRFRQLPGRAYLLLAMIIYGTANSVTRRLTDLGAQNLIEGRNPISFCNVLFVGNLCALVALFVLYHSQLKRSVFSQLSRRNWIGLIAVAILAGALAPSLIFAALQETTVNNVILVGRLEPPLTLALSVMLLSERVNRWVVASAVVSFLGVLLTVILQSPQPDMVSMGGFQVGLGELMVAGWAIAAAIANIISKITLQDVPLGLFNLARTSIGTVVFFIVALQIYGSEHFMDVSSPLLWQWMVFYGAVIVVGGQVCWFAGLKRATASEVSLATSFNPIAGILAAFLILGEAPTMAQYIGGVVIFAGIALNQWGIIQQRKEPVMPPEELSLPEEMELSSSVGFKGV